MSSTNSTIKWRQCLSDKTIPFKPLLKIKTACLFHPQRANCRAINNAHFLNTDCAVDSDDSNTDNDDDDDEFINLYHETVLSVVYLDYNRRPYFYRMLNAAERRNKSVRGYVLNASDVYAYVRIPLIDSDEQFFGIDENGERQLATLSVLIKTVLEAFEYSANRVLLFVDELYVDVLYSALRAIVLPQRVLAIPFADGAFALSNFKCVSVPATDEAKTCQKIYRTFVLYNTVLTVMLKQRNPFNEPHKNISIILRTLGKCPNNKERIKCCDLKYGGGPPAHFMCPPRNMIKRIFHYSKWARTPNNYKRYAELIVKPAAIKRRYTAADPLQNAADAIRQSADDLNYLMLDWYNFIQDFRAYFHINN
nr:VP1054 [Calliteara abietis nucleopolyhedrovirus]